MFALLTGDYNQKTCVNGDRLALALAGSQTTLTMDDGTTKAVTESPSAIQSALGGSTHILLTAASGNAAVLVNKSRIVRTEPGAGTTNSILLAGGTSITVTQSAQQIKDLT